MPPAYPLSLIVLLIQAIVFKLPQGCALIKDLVATPINVIPTSNLASLETVSLDSTLECFVVYECNLHKVSSTKCRLAFSRFAVAPVKLNSAPAQVDRGRAKVTFEDTKIELSVSFLMRRRW